MSFKSDFGRDPIPGVDYSLDDAMSQDEYEYLTGTGAYLPRDHGKSQHYEIVKNVFAKLFSWLTQRVPDVCNASDCKEPAVNAGLCQKHSF